MTQPNFEAILGDALASLKSASNILESQGQLALSAEVHDATVTILDTIVRMMDGLDTVSKKLHDGTLHVVYCNGDHNARVGEEGKVCNCTLGQEIKGLRHQVQELTKDKLLLDNLEEILKTEERVDLGYTEAWIESGEYGAILSQGPEEFWVSDTGKTICRTLREAIADYIKRRP